MSEVESKKTGSSLTEVAWERIGAFFVARNLKQYWFGMFGSVKQAALSHWLARRRAPNLENIEKLAKDLGVKPKCLICREEDSVCITCTHERRPPRLPVAP